MASPVQPSSQFKHSADSHSSTGIGIETEPDTMSSCYVLLGVGLSAFGQLKALPQITGTAGERSEAVPGDSSRERQDESLGEAAGQTGGELMVSSPRSLMLFSSKPDSLHISSAWDALHVHMTSSGSGRGNSLTRGRWSTIVGSREEVMQVVESKDVLLLHTASQWLATGHSEIAVFSECCSLSGATAVGSVSDGTLYVLTTTGQLYQCSPATPPATPPDLRLSHPILPSLTVSAISCGSDHALFLSHTGTVYALGLGSRGQLGLGDILPRKEPVLVEALAGVAVGSVKCGNWHSLALSLIGDVYSWGWNEQGQLGHSAGATATVPGLIEVGEDVNFTCIGCGARHSAAVSDTGALYTWGWNGYGQLGVAGRACAHVPEVVEWDREFKPVDVFCSHWSTLVLCEKLTGGNNC